MLSIIAFSLQPVEAIFGNFLIKATSQPMQWEQGLKCAAMPVLPCSGAIWDRHFRYGKAGGDVVGRTNIEKHPLGDLTGHFLFS
jgi:hypothetical protein